MEHAPSRTRTMRSLALLFSAAAALRPASRAALPRARRLRAAADGGAPSASGRVYDDGGAGGPVVRLFTKPGCTLCDDARAVLEAARATSPHTLEAVDIGDAENRVWWDKYKYDIPVLHVGDAYWTKHRVTLDEVEATLAEAAGGAFEAREGEPNAKELLGY